MRSVGVRQFRDQATTMMGAGETLVIERHGEPIGFFVPIVAKDRRVGQDALGHLGELLDLLGRKTGLDEEQLISEMTGARRSK